MVLARAARRVALIFVPYAFYLLYKILSADDRISIDW